MACVFLIYGFLITDGSIGKNRILFHAGSKLFLNELSKLIAEIIKVRRTVKEFIQYGKYHSYQLTLNKKERALFLSEMPTWDNGTPAVLSS